MFSNLGEPSAALAIAITLMLGVANLVFVIVAAKWALTCFVLAKLRLRSGARLPIAEEAADLEARRQARPWLASLGSLGFTAPRVSQDDVPKDLFLGAYDWQVLHWDTKTIANLRVSIPLAGNKSFIRLSFHTFLADGRVLVTGEHQTICEHPPADWLLEQGRFPKLADQWMRHRARLQALENSASPILPEPVEQAMNDSFAAADQASVRAGLLQPDPRNPGQYRLSRGQIPFAALKLMWNTLPWIGRNRSLARKDVAAPPDIRSLADPRSAEQLAEADLRKFRQAVGNASLGKMGKFALLVVTLVIFTLWWKDDNKSGMVGVIIGILILHEFGHWLPMKLFGYKNVTMFFIPGFGAAVSGTKHHAPAWQELIVLLGGPLPGMFAGLAVLVFGYFNREVPDLALNAAALAVAINAFNLLPILPLDGGRILDLLVFKEVPTLRILFSGISALAALVVSLTMHGAFRYVAIIMILNLVGEVKRVKLIKEARKSAWAGQESDEDTVLRRLFTEIRKAGNHEYTTGKDWVPRTKAVLEELLRRKPDWLTRLGGLGIYGAACLVPVFTVTAILTFMFAHAIFAGLDRGKRIAEFQPPTPTAAQDLNESQWHPITRLMEESTAYWEEREYPTKPDDIDQLAAAAPVELRKQVDQLRWEHVATARHSGEVDADCAAFWLETGCLALDSAVAENRNPEALRRAEILLHALHALTPADSHQTRERCDSTQIRVLKAVASLNGKGAIPPDMQTKLRGRIELLRTAPKADQEAFLLADGWSDKEFGGSSWLDNLQNEADGMNDDASFFRQFYQAIDNRNSIIGSDPLAYQVAAHWKKGGNPGELPAEAPAKRPVAKEEAEYLRGFLERRREVLWQQYAILYTFNVEDFRRQKARLPQQWTKEIPGGAVIELVHGDKPCLRVSDRRGEDVRSSPTWLGLQAAPTIPAIEVPLSPVSGLSGSTPPAEASKQAY